MYKEGAKMKTDDKVAEEYIKQGHTEKELVEEVQKQVNGKPCLACGKFPLLYVGSWMGKSKKLILYGLCKECFQKLQKNEKKFIKQIEKKLVVREMKKKLDARYDCNEVM